MTDVSMLAAAMTTGLYVVRLLNQPVLLNGFKD
jgi:hypothetical protein